MDPNTLKLLMGSAGAGAVADKVYIEDVFSTYLYTGDSSTQTITNGIDLSGKGGLTWIKARASSGHRLTDTIRGSTKSLDSSSSLVEATETTGLTAFNTTGFTIGSDNDYNTFGIKYASWSFCKQAKFFDVVTYTGTGANRTVAHNLGSVPGTIIVKRRDISADWQVYHRSLANTEYLVLNSTATKATGATRWNSTTPTSTVFSLGTDTTVNANGGTYVAYLFAHDAGGFGDSGNDNVISCGSFTTDSGGNATVTLGWEPQFVLIKESTAAASYGWILLDTLRGWDLNATDRVLYAESTGAESSFGAGNPTSTGFISPTLFGTSTYIYIAIRRGPMKTPTDATKVFSAILQSPQSAGTVRTIGFPADLVIGNLRSATVSHYFQDRLRGFPLSGTTQNTLSVKSDSTAAETSEYPYFYDVWNTTAKDGDLAFMSNGVGWTFRRAPGFFDVVAYTGTGSVRTVSHNLGVAPELIVIKGRDFARSWIVYSQALGVTKYLLLNANNAGDFDSGVIWNNTNPTSSVFTLATNGTVNFSGEKFIAYLFATCPGVSKVGSYTGTGATLSVDCGFTNGARFVLIKRTDSTGDWYVWDTARGIISANDPFLLLNTTTAENTSTDYIDPLSTGFQISSTAPAAINANGGNFIYLAIA